MDGRLYWAGPTCGDLLPTSFATVRNGRATNPGGKEWDRAFAEHVTLYAAITSMRRTARLATSRISIIDDETWAIRYLVVDTRNWWPGKKVLVSPRWIERVSWDLSKVFVNLSRDAIKKSPEYSEEALLTRDYETRLHGHYNRQGYWIEEARQNNAPPVDACTRKDVHREQDRKQLSPDLLRKMNAYWRAANYLSVGQIYLYDNPLLKRPLRLSDVKPTLLGHWGTTPGQNFIYVHLNRVIKKYDLDMIYIAGPGHGGPDWWAIPISKAPTVRFTRSSARTKAD